MKFGRRIYINNYDLTLIGYYPHYVNSSPLNWKQYRFVSEETKQKHLTKFQSPLFATITSMKKFADFTLYILKCRVVPSFIHLVMSAMFIWTYSYVSYSMQLIV